MIPEVNPPAARQRSGCFSWQRLTLTSPVRCALLGAISADILAVREPFQAGRCAAYGEQILATVSQELTAEVGAGFNYTALTRMVRFAEWVTDEANVVTPSRHSSGSHFRASLAVAGMAIPSERKEATT